MKQRSKVKLFLLLDESVPPRKYLPRMNSRGKFNIRDILNDYKLRGEEDPTVLRKAEQEKRILVTADKGFIRGKKIQKKTAIVKIPRLPPKETDELLARLTKKFPEQEMYSGKLFLVDRSCKVEIRDYLGNDKNSKI